MDAIIFLVLFIGFSVVAVNLKCCGWAGYFGILVGLLFCIFFIIPVINKL